MKKQTPTIKTLMLFIVFVIVVTLLSCNGDGNSNISQSEIDSLRNEVKLLTSNDATLAKNLTTFDTLDYTVFTNQEWTRLHESHAQDIKVYWPDGHVTEGLEKHIEDLKMLFVYAPDTRIKQHPIRFGSGNMTAVTGVFEGTFTKPMPIGNGKFIQPTGKAFKMPMCTIGIWKPDGTMSEEHLFWDNQTYMNQIGLGK
jgi:hypothetical protein